MGLYRDCIGLGWIGLVGYRGLRGVLLADALDDVFGGDFADFFAIALHAAADGSGGAFADFGASLDHELIEDLVVFEDLQADLDEACGFAAAGGDVVHVGADHEDVGRGFAGVDTDPTFDTTEQGATESLGEETFVAFKFLFVEGCWIAANFQVGEDDLLKFELGICLAKGVGFGLSHHFVGGATSTEEQGCEEEKRQRTFTKRHDRDLQLSNQEYERSKTKPPFTTKLQPFQGLDCSHAETGETADNTEREPQ